MSNLIFADVVRGASLDALYVVPVRHVDPLMVMSVLKGILGESSLRRTASGIALSLESSHALSNYLGTEFKWSPEALLFIRNRLTQMQSHMGHVTAVRAIEQGDAENAKKLLIDDERLRILDSHQVKNVAAMSLKDSPGLCLFDEQGAGKTVSMIYTFDELVSRNEVDFMLIVAPKSMVGEWPKDIHRFMSDTYRVAVAEGSASKKKSALRQSPDILITNFETTVTMEKELEAFLRSHEGRAVLVVDESFFIKSPDAQRTMALRRLREWCGRAYVLCGTPAPNSPIDLVQQFSFVDFGTAFNDVDIPDDRELSFPVVQRVVDEKGLYLRNLKCDVLPDLPIKRFQKIVVEMEPKQAALYQMARSALAQQLEVVSDAEFRRNITNFLSQRALLLQICSNPAAATENYNATPAKVQALDRLLEQLVVEQNEKVIVWSFYTATIDLLVERYAHYGVVRYDGKVTDVEERQKSVDRFQRDDEIKVFIANPAAAGAGLTLHSARVAIYESMSNQAAHYLQSIDRIHRRGQHRDVEYIVLLCNNTVEEYEYQRLLGKEASAQSLLGDPVGHQLMRGSMLEEVLGSLKLDTASL